MYVLKTVALTVEVNSVCLLEKYFMNHSLKKVHTTFKIKIFFHPRVLLYLIALCQHILLFVNLTDVEKKSDVETESSSKYVFLVLTRLAHLVSRELFQILT